MINRSEFPSISKVEYFLSGCAKNEAYKMLDVLREDTYNNLLQNISILMTRNVIRSRSLKNRLQHCLCVKWERALSNY